MSFILDALRKSDQQRQRGAAPTLLSAPALAAESKKPAYWTQGLIAAVLVGAGIAIGWLRPWQPAQPPAVNTRAAPASAAANSPAPRPAALVPLPALPAASNAPAQAVPKEKQPPAPASPGAAATPDRAPPSSGAQARAAPSASPAPEKTTGAADAAAEQKVVAMSELPAAIRQELPAMQVLLHQYSPKPANRYVTINNQTLQEGESVAPGLTLEQITRDGMILSYRGFRFRRGVP